MEKIYNYCSNTIIIYDINLLDDKYKLMWLDDIIKLTKLTEYEIIKQLEFITMSKYEITICWNKYVIINTFIIINKNFYEYYDNYYIINYYNNSNIYTNDYIYMKLINLFIYYFLFYFLFYK